MIFQPVPQDCSFGIREEDWPDTTEAGADRLKWYDSLEPLIFTDEERAAWKAALQEQ